jgi:uncharacterized protein (DUF1330 family)
MRNIVKAGVTGMPYSNQYNALERQSRVYLCRGGDIDNNAACMITHVEVKDEEKWDEYRSQVPATLSEWGAEVVFRGKRTEVLTGEHEYTHTIITRFPNATTICTWYEAPPYQALIPLRGQAVEMALIGYEPFD